MKLDDIDLRRLRYFLVVAQELHFTRAAEKIGIRQPPLSMQIRKLEETIGARLFIRHSRSVELTPAGREFQAAAIDIVARLEDAVAEARRYQAGNSGRLRLGFAGATYFHPAIPIIMRAYRTAHPDVVLSPEQAVPLSLLATETVTNAIKYMGAVEQGTKPWIRISLRNTGEGTCSFAVSNSKGIRDPKTEVKASTGLGRQLIDAFAMQLGTRPELLETSDSYTLQVNIDLNRAG